MSLANKVRQLRYAKGWGPDDLAARANISRTALYQIECGRTAIPRASTLRRLARALNIGPEQLLSPDSISPGHPMSADVAPLESFSAAASPEERHVAASLPTQKQLEDDIPALRDLELERKFRVLLNSHMREAVVVLVEQSYRLLALDQRKEG